MTFAIWQLKIKKRMSIGHCLRFNGLNKSVIKQSFTREFDSFWGVLFI